MEELESTTQVLSTNILPLLHLIQLSESLYLEQLSGYALIYFNIIFIYFYIYTFINIWY